MAIKSQERSLEKSDKKRSVAFFTFESESAHLCDYRAVPHITQLMSLLVGGLPAARLLCLRVNKNASIYK
jgi:hypothetical protein